MENRNIKFRAWSENDKEMSLPKDIYDLLVYNYNWYVARVHFRNARYVPYSDCKIMQFTGLLDKNKKDIYEGDIIKYNEDAIRVIVFDNGCFHARVKDWKPNSDKASFPIFFLPITNNNTEEIIGNIYENPKLLNNK